MNGHLKAHMKHMIVGGAGILVLLVVLGVNWPQALTWALLLACPAGMMGMMWLMGRQNAGGAGHEHGAGSNSESVPQQRVSEGSTER